VRTIRIAILLAVVSAACAGSGGGSTTTAAEEEATTTAAAPAATTTTAAEEEGEGPAIGLDEVPQECIDQFVEFLQAIEPIVEPIDWANATMADLEELGTQLEPLSDEFDTAIDENSECANLNVEASDEETFEVMIEIARDEAPGTVAYFEWIRDFAVEPAGGSEVSGDCETDIAAMQAIIDEGGTMADLPLAELTAVGELMTAISTECSRERADEFLASEDVLAWLGG
jgi:hypothetical protein